MVGSRTLTALAGLALSIALSAVVWRVFDVPFLFFAVPFVPFLFSRRLRGGTRSGGPERPVRECPVCGFRTADPRDDYCPRDGTRLDDGEGRGEGRRAGNGRTG